jgi:hypothetical protein
MISNLSLSYGCHVFMYHCGYSCLGWVLTAMLQLIYACNLLTLLTLIINPCFLGVFRV